MGQHEPLYLDALDQGVPEGMLQSDDPYPMWRSEDRAMHNPAFHDADKEKRYNAASDLDAPSLQGQDHLFKPRPCSFDPFEAAWNDEEALEKEKRCNAAANLHAGGHSNFFSLADILVRPCMIATDVPLSNLLHLFTQASKTVVVLLAPVMDF